MLNASQKIKLLVMRPRRNGCGSREIGDPGRSQGLRRGLGVAHSSGTGTLPAVKGRQVEPAIRNRCQGADRYGARDAGEVSGLNWLISRIPGGQGRGHRDSEVLANQRCAGTVKIVEARTHFGRQYTSGARW